MCEYTRVGDMYCTWLRCTVSIPYYQDIPDALNKHRRQSRDSVAQTNYTKPCVHRKGSLLRSAENRSDLWAYLLCIIISIRRICVPCILYSLVMCKGTGKLHITSMAMHHFYFGRPITCFLYILCLGYVMFWRYLHTYFVSCSQNIT